MRDRTVVQWDKDDLQELGLIKIDLLGLGMLSLLREAFTLYRRSVARGDPWLPPARSARDLAAAHDPRRAIAPTYAMMQRADTIGVFQIESRAQQSMLPRSETGLLLRHRDAGRDHSRRVRFKGR